MKISNIGIEILKRIEGCVKIGAIHVAYNDETGQPLEYTYPLPRGATIGYGHLIKPGENFQHGITETAAIQLLRSDVAIAERAVNNCINVPLSQNQYDALVLLAYNIGPTQFSKSSVVKHINRPGHCDARYPTLESAWMAWNKSRGKTVTGLTNRRKQEWKLFNARTYTSKS